MRALIVLFIIASAASAASWPGVEYAEVRGYAYNHKDTASESRPVPSTSGRLISEGGRLNTSVLNKSGTMLTPDQARRLIRAVTENFPQPPGARCWRPHHGFVFYDARRKPVAWVEVCFECGNARVHPERDDRRYTDMKTLRILADELKLPDPPREKT